MAGREGPPPGQATIGGDTRLLVIVGDPIGQVKSPAILNPRLHAAALDAVLVPVHAPADRFDAVMAGLKAIANLDGIVVTVPFKMRASPCADRVLATGEAAGAVNALRREPDGSWTADMFDGTGLVAGLGERGIAAAGRRVMLLGAGGAGSAVAAAFAAAGAAAVTIHDIDAAKAQDLAGRIARIFPRCTVAAGPPALPSHDILVNATPIGMREEDPLPVGLDDLSPDTLVVDVIMRPDVTRLMEVARDRGSRVLGGRVMLDGQASALLRFFRIEGDR